MKPHYELRLLAVVLLLQLHAGLANECSGDRVCPGGLCCSKFGWCGYTEEFCGSGCQSQCEQYQVDFVDEQTYYKINPNRRDSDCEARDEFYAYEDFVLAARDFPMFAKTGNNETRKKELAAFFGYTTFVTSGGRKGSHNDPYKWGYCDVTDDHDNFNSSKYYDSRYAKQYPCSPDQKYYGRGPMKIKWNYNYGKAAAEMDDPDILSNPNILEENATMAFKVAIWQWTTRDPKSQKPSAHEVITGKWKPTFYDESLGRRSGYGSVTNVLAGPVACGKGPTCETADRVGFYKRVASILGVDPGKDMDCDHQIPFDAGLFPLKSASQE